jgi:hypothetical protein
MRLQTRAHKDNDEYRGIRSRKWVISPPVSVIIKGIDHRAEGGIAVSLHNIPVFA